MQLGTLEMKFLKIEFEFEVINYAIFWRCLMNILLSNDDGIMSPGIIILKEYLEQNIIMYM